MHVFSLLSVSLLAITANASPLEDIFGRAVGDSCKAPEGKGTCQSTSNCKGISYPTGLCPNDPNDVQCCVNIDCKVPSVGSGFCRSKSNNGCSGGSFHAGFCPGDSDIQCCVKSSSGGSDPPSSGNTIGEKILAKAMAQKGVPYAWGGGSCKGPTSDQPPADYGEIGFDCSGLVAYAVCQVTGRDLFSEGLRVTRSMYCASESKLKYKKVPYSQRRPGDAVFFGRKQGGSCDCENNREGIHHVGLMMDSGDRLWNAPNDRVNKVQENSIAGFGDLPCENVIRFG